MFIDLQFSLEKIFHGFVENTSCIFDLGVLSFLFFYTYICSFHNVLEILNILCLVFCRFNIFFDRDIRFFCHVFNAWDSLFHLLYSVMKFFSKKFLKFSFPYFLQFGIYLLVLFPFSGFELFLFTSFYHLFVFSQVSLWDLFISALRTSIIFTKAHFVSSLYGLSMWHFSGPIVILLLESSGIILSLLLLTELLPYCLGIWNWDYYNSRCRYLVLPLLVECYVH